ncbi:hypothetical protein JX266_013306 [Neoarthrinium moseri]|nr:hypothetical protein JX266_013306 [Neoarthrinium moseri]
MKCSGYLLTVLSGASVALAAPLADDVGTGPYPAAYFTETSLPKHTIYRPINPPANVSLPVLVWGQGGCAADGLQERSYLIEIASHGFIAIASGAPGGTGSTTSALMTESITWVGTQAGTSGPYGNVDAKKIAAAGGSCGGLEAYDVIGNAAVDIIGIFSSGYIGNNAAQASKLKKPVFYFLGNTGDIAYANGLADYGNITATPKWFGSYNVGHMGTLTALHGGAWGTATVQWLEWGLKGNLTAAKFFTDGGAQTAGWSKVQSADLDSFLSFIGPFDFQVAIWTALTCYRSQVPAYT